MPLAAKEEMLSPSSDPCVFFPLAAFGGVGENSRLGSARRKTALHPGRAWSNSARALGIEEVLVESRGGCRSSGNRSGSPSLKQNFLNLDVCIANNAKNFSLGGVANLTAGYDLPLLGNDVTDTALLVTGNLGLADSAGTSVSLGRNIFNATNNPIMTNGPNSLTTLTAQRGSPQRVLGSGTNYQTSFLGKVAKFAAKAKGIVDVALAGALVVDCALGQVH
jgi:hypothetical protein